MTHQFPGLSTEQARQKLLEFGHNEIKEVNKATPITLLLRQVQKNFVIYLLLAAGLISFFVGEPITAIAILVVIVIIVAVGFIQEYRAEVAIAALKKMVMPVTKVIRDGKETEIPSADLVPSDVIVLRTGEKIPADCVLLEEKNILVNESLLTGESADIKKSVSLSRDNLTDENKLFMGTFIVEGRGIAEVAHTGMNTKFGAIANLISTTEKELPLQNKVNKIAKYMVVIAILSSLATGILIISRAEYLNYDTLISVLIIVIALAVSSFPEGLPLVLVTTLALGAKRMAKKNAIVNRMSIIETLGETTVICADKTGTITTGEMTVRNIYVDHQIYEVTGIGYEGTGGFIQDGKKIDPNNNVKLFLRVAALCNDSNIERTGEDDKYKVNGTPTEGALLIAAAKANIFPEDIKFSREEEMPFSSSRKMMSILINNNDRTYVYAKGAPEVLLSKCSFIKIGDQSLLLDHEEKLKVLSKNQELTNSALRTLAIAYKEVGQNQKTYEEDELIFLGLIAMEDPPREEIKTALNQAHHAGITVKMITGDHQDTAVAIGREIGLVGQTLTGVEIDNLSKEELFQKVKETVIFSRVKPEHKLRIVEALKAHGETVAMTGDGVNDAPALKEAHVGIAMGINGTDVSRSVADLTLKDDNFATIIEAIKEGRTVFNNIRKFVSYELSCNAAELTTLFLGVLIAPYLGWQVPILVALQILFMNLVTDNLPSLSLGFNPTSPDIMNYKPRFHEDILNRKLIILVLVSAAMMGGLAIISYFISFNILGLSHESAQTTALVTLILLEVANAFNFRSFRQKILNRSPFINRTLFIASAMSILLTILIVYTPLNAVFETQPIGELSWFLAATLTVLFILVFDLAKFINSFIQRVRHI